MLAFLGLAMPINSITFKPSMKIKSSIIEVELKKGPDILDITDEIKRLLLDSRITEGICSLNCIGSTGSLTTIEFESGVIEDLKSAINRIAPPDMEYKHELAWHDGNGHSHVQAALLGPSLTISIKAGKLLLGTWQQVVVINHDNRPRRRKIACTLIGK